MVDVVPGPDPAVDDLDARVGLHEQVAAVGVQSLRGSDGPEIGDGVVEQINVEAPGEYSASSAETLLGQL